MAKRTGALNAILLRLIMELKEKSAEQNVGIWRRIAYELEKPTRQRRIINLSRIDRYAKDDEVIIVPGKVLGAGTLSHRLTIAAYQFSQSAREKLEKSGSKIMTLSELIKENPTGKGVRIIG